LNSSTNASRLLLSLAFLCSNAFAQIASDDFICRYDGSQREMNACAIRDYKKADDDLNKAYSVAMSKFKQGDRVNMQILMVEQRDWIRRRDARCGPKDDGTENATIDYMTCMQEFTEIRTLQLLAR